MVYCTVTSRPPTLSSDTVKSALDPSLTLTGSSTDTLRLPSSSVMVPVATTAAWARYTAGIEVAHLVVRLKVSVFSTRWSSRTWMPHVRSV